MTTAAPVAVEPPKPPEWNRIGVDYQAPMHRPRIKGLFLDAHCHLFAARHAKVWFEAAHHYSIDCFITMTPLEEALTLARDYGDRLQFIAIPKWVDESTNWVDEWLRRIESFYNIGARIAKFHAAPSSMQRRGKWLDDPVFKPLFKELVDRKMVIMTHIGDPDTWYTAKYTDIPKYGARDDHYRMWQGLLEEYRGTPWLGAHLGGNPENFDRLQTFLDRFPDLVLDCSATRWMVREVSARRDIARAFFIRNQDRLLFGSDQVSTDDRGFDFLASRFWCHRMLWETDLETPTPIADPDLPLDEQPMLRGLSLPDDVLQKLYHDNAIKLLARVGTSFGEHG